MDQWRRVKGLIRSEEEESLSKQSRHKGPGSKEARSDPICHLALLWKASRSFQQEPQI